MRRVRRSPGAKGERAGRRRGEEERRRPGEGGHGSTVKGASRTTLSGAEQPRASQAWKETRMRRRCSPAARRREPDRGAVHRAAPEEWTSTGAARSGQGRGQRPPGYCGRPDLDRGPREGEGQGQQVGRIARAPARGEGTVRHHVRARRRPAGGPRPSRCPRADRRGRDRRLEGDRAAGGAGCGRRAAAGRGVRGFGRRPESSPTAAASDSRPRGVRERSAAKARAVRRARSAYRVSPVARPRRRSTDTMTAFPEGSGPS